MKRYFPFFLFSVALFLCNIAHTHTAVEVFNSKYVKLIEGNSKMMLIENVVIRYGDLSAEADSALLEKPKQLVTIYGIRKIIFKGERLDPAKFKKAIRYQKGAETLQR